MSLLVPEPESRTAELQTAGAAADASVYLDRLSDWDGSRSLRTRLSGRLARHLPLRPCRLRNDRPLVTFTFDDVPRSALAIGADALEQAGARGSFYISTALLGLRTRHWTVIDADGVRELHRRGHDIGLHGHRHHPGGMLSASQFADDVARNRAALHEIEPAIRADNFAYPYGQVDFPRKRQLGGLVRSSRSIHPGLNRGVVDLHHLKSVSLEDAVLGPAQLGDWLDRAAGGNGWLIFLLHDVAEQAGPFGVSRRLLDQAIEGALRRGLEIRTTSAALDAAGVGAR
jgi:peptidoglycan/xylan/chitin deacetylase (PgdA/CDA1 family)